MLLVGKFIVRAMPQSAAALDHTLKQVIFPTVWLSHPIRQDCHHNPEHHEQNPA